MEELDFSTYLRALEGKQETFEQELVKCVKCGAEQHLEASLFASKCTFCSAAIVSKSYANRRIKPKSVVPFQVDRKRAQDAFRRWVKKLWLAPSDLKRYAQSDMGLSGVYMPFWTYDCSTSSQYEGERGEDYYTGTGKQRTRHTRWTAVSGHIEKFHDDVLVMASKTLPETVVGATARWDLKKLVPYQPEFVSGFQAEAYQVGLRDSYPQAKAIIEAHVADLVRRDIGGDHQKIHSVSTRYADIKFKHVLLPVWVSAYRYRDKPFRFIINGQTGEVSGESPKSAWKIALLVIAILVGLFILLMIGGR